MFNRLRRTAVLLLSVFTGFIANAQSLEHLPDSAVAPPQTDATAAKIVELHLQSRGNADAIRRITSLYADGSFSEAKTEHRIQWWWRAPQKFRVELSRLHLGRNHRDIRVADEDAAWIQTLSPQVGRAKRQEAAALRELRWDGALGVLAFNQLVDWEERGYTLAYDGTSNYAGRPVYLIKAQLDEGRIVYYYIDRKTFILRAIGIRDRFAGAEVNADVVPTGARIVEGVMMETGWEWIVDGSVYRRLQFNRIETNPDIPQGHFTFPPEDEEIWLRQGQRR